MYQKFCKKPVVVEALQFNQDNIADVIRFTNHTAHAVNKAKGVSDYDIIIPTLEGRHIATEGDYIIKGIKGEFYPCKPDVFERTYEPADRSEPLTSY